MSAHEIEYIEADEEYVQQNQSDLVETEVQDEVEDHWEHNSIKLMLNLYLQNIDKFRNPKIKKKNVWVEISNAVAKGPDSCDKKFRNLKQTYIRLLKKKNKNELLKVRWPYFTIFEEIYNVDGEYQPDIQQKIQENTTDNVAKVLLSINTPTFQDVHENGEGSSSQNEEVRRKQNKRRFTEFRKVTLEMRERQRVVEEKLDKLISIVEESNGIQRERNRLFELFLEKLNNT
ncbi:uncharacterized protein LOC131851714 isoform X1 [Achroia grisella]|uniref:uncharacterized protein LOC131851714 isoform X1 n=2 Tax=Achroia grisella TaxID=688607 RepID=UPI0027D25266|nr:uncharacterized protein LOC131851714 isoform X1 [Achroia grisella]